MPSIIMMILGALITTTFSLTSFAGVTPPTPGTGGGAPGTNPIVLPKNPRPTFKVPSKLTARMPIAKDIKDFLDRDFRSRYPVAAPIKVDVVQADVQMYNIWQVANGYGGFDERHSFRVYAYHADRSIVQVDINIYKRTQFEPDQDPILLESFRIVGMTR